MDRYKVSLKDEDTMNIWRWCRDNIPEGTWDWTFDEAGAGIITYHFSNKDDLTKFILTWL